MECEICGKEASLKKVKIEGAVLSVCEECSKLGEEIKTTEIIVKKKTPEIKIEEYEPDFADKIKKAREDAKLTVEELAKEIRESPRLIERIEKGMKPTLEVAKKLEKKLDIKLFAQQISIEKVSNAEPLTLGDVANIKIRKKK